MPHKICSAPNSCRCSCLYEIRPSATTFCKPRGVFGDYIFFGAVGPGDAAVFSPASGSRWFAEYDFDDSGELAYHEYIKYTIRDALSRSTERVLSLFKLWDADSSGTLDKEEFRRAIATIGFKAPREEVDALFDDMDEDHSGDIDYQEVHARTHSRTLPPSALLIYGD